MIVNHCSLTLVADALIHASFLSAVRSNDHSYIAGNCVVGRRLSIYLDALKSTSSHCLDALIFN